MRDEFNPQPSMRDIASNAKLFKPLRAIYYFLAKVIFRADFAYMIPEHAAGGWLPLAWSYFTKWGAGKRVVNGYVGLLWSTRFAHARLSFETANDTSVSLSIAVPWLIFFSISVKGPISNRISSRLCQLSSKLVRKSREHVWDCEIELSMHDWTLWWSFLQPQNSWSNTDPKWAHCSFNVLDFLLGKRQHERTQVHPPVEVLVSLPEGNYPVVMELERRRWWRARWPFWPCKTERVSWDVKIENGIPFSGKGENSWDCGEDGLYGTGVSWDDHRTPYEAGTAIAAIVLAYRTERGDNPCWPVKPEERLVAMEAARQKRREAVGDVGPAVEKSP